ncbi:hypothetical protein GS883_21735 [Rhodococcus hoagii]|nr:hypothetical protein [Prescottella equi]
MAVAAAVAVTITSSGVAAAQSSPEEVSAAIPCTPLHTVGIQGTGQSAPDASPTIDRRLPGMSVMIPLLNAAPGDVSRQLVPYAAAFGSAGLDLRAVDDRGVEKAIEVISSYVLAVPELDDSPSPPSRRALKLRHHRPEHRCRRANLR